MCHAIWSGGADGYPAVDLSALAERKLFEKARLERDFAEYERLCSLVQPLMPEGTWPRPGTQFGPLVGTARGGFAPLVLQYGDSLLLQHDALSRLQDAGVRGLLGCPTALRFQKKGTPELLELQLEPRGLLHPDCLPAGDAEPCPKCGRYVFSRPDAPLLDAASLPGHLDLFRLSNFTTMLIATERFVEAVRRHELRGLLFVELPAR